MKLYDKARIFQPVVSVEKFPSNYAQSVQVSTESVNLFLAGVKDSLNSVLLKVDPNQSLYEAETRNNKNRVMVLTREKSFKDFRHTKVSKPESFRGYYQDYARDLCSCAANVTQMCNMALETLQMTLGSFINDNNEDQVSQIYGQSIYVQMGKTLPILKKALAGYFKDPAGNFKTYPDQILKSFADFEVIYAHTEKLSELFSPSLIEAMQKRVKSTTDLVDTLVEVNTHTGALSRSSTSKKQLIDAIYLTAEAVEVYHATLAHWVMFCKAFGNLTTSLVNFDSSAKTSIS